MDKVQMISRKRTRMKNINQIVQEFSKENREGLWQHCGRYQQSVMERICGENYRLCIPLKYSLVWQIWQKLLLMAVVSYYYYCLLAQNFKLVQHCRNNQLCCVQMLPSVAWHCWLGDTKVRPVNSTNPAIDWVFLSLWSLWDWSKPVIFC